METKIVPNANKAFTWSATQKERNARNRQNKEPDYKTLKYSTEIQSIFPLTPVKTDWKADLKKNYQLVEDESWDKGFKVWRSLPMRSELEQKLKVGDGDIRRSSDFTRTERPEAYLPGFTVRKVGPISRPRDSRSRVIRQPIVAPQVKKDSTKSREVTQMSESRRESAGVLQDGILKTNKTVA